jgi:hypothetical protein
MINTYISKNILQYTVDEDYFKNNGYVYTELSGFDIPCYYKEINGRTIWCKTEGKRVVIDDWHRFLTPTIINYFVQYRNGENVRYSKMFDYLIDLFEN